MNNATTNQIHVRAWAGSCSFTVTDMTNAGKRGKRCPQMRFVGWSPIGGDAIHARIRDFTCDVIAWAEKLDASTPFAEVAAELRTRVSLAGLPEHAASVFEDDVRGIDAPRPILSARVAGKWSASADEHGITVSDEVDQNNQPALITSGQTPARAYQLAASAWERVQRAASFSEVGDVLAAVGCRLHYYCRMD